MKKLATKGGEAISSLPDEIYHEILLRVPAKSTYACKCVCKSWFEIINNPDFVKMHLDVTAQKNNPSLIVRCHTICSTDYDTLVSSNNGSEVYVSELDYPFKSSDYKVKLLGSANGLCCLWSAKIHNYTYHREEFFCLWNPITKEFKKLPQLPSKYFDTGRGIYGFGYDPKFDDYKLIIGCYASKIQVYTLGTDSWKDTQIVPYVFCFGPFGRGVLLKGALHWFGETAEKDIPRIIISLDVSDEKVEDLQLPSKLLKYKHWSSLSMTIGVMQESLCVLVTVKTDFEVWVMKDHGVQESWTKHYSISWESVGETHWPMLLRSFKNGQILLMIGYKLVIYDPKHSSGREPTIFSNFRLYDAVNYVESLVSLNSGTYARRNKV